MELDSRRNHEDVGRPECAPSLAQLTRGWRAQWRAALISVSFSLQIGTSAGSLRIRVRRFDSSRGHPGYSRLAREVEARREALREGGDEARGALDVRERAGLDRGVDVARRNRDQA
jgi:hypothetical protein